MRSYHLRPWQISFFIHAMILIFMTLLLIRPQNKTQEENKVIVDISIKEIPKSIAPLQQNKVINIRKFSSVNDNLLKKKERKIFGVKKSTHTNSPDDQHPSLNAKIGNTVAKNEDHIEMTKDDIENLPSPVEEYLVTQMPIVLQEIKPQFPTLAKTNQIQGIVIFELLIDEQGEIRQIDIIEGNDIFREVALEAMKKFRFAPAKIDSKVVAVRIRYLMRFELES